MLFRMPDGELAEVRRYDYNCLRDYYEALMEVYGVCLPSDNTWVRDDLSQVDFIYGLITRSQPSRL